MGNFFERIKNVSLFRKTLYAMVGVFTYPGLAIINSISISGTEHIKNLPKRNVLFVSNHQTYFADVITFLHIFCAVKWRKENRLGIPYYLLNPFSNVYFVAAEETMKDNWLTKLFAMAGALTVKRTWRAEGTEVRRNLNPADTRKIQRALDKSWVITFPQGTTKPFAPGRRGTAYIIKENNPIVIPVVINGFWRAFNKKGLHFKKKGSLLTVKFKPPMHFSQDETLEGILDRVMDAIEQSRKFMMKGRHHLITAIDK